MALEFVRSDVYNKGTNSRNEHVILCVDSFYVLPLKYLLNNKNSSPLPCISAAEGNTGHTRPAAVGAGFRGLGSLQQEGRNLGEHGKPFTHSQYAQSP